MANFYIAVTVEQDRNENIFEGRTAPEYNPGYYAYVLKTSDQHNLKSELERIGGLKCAHIYPTKKRAAEIVQFWNDGYKANGTYLFDTPNF